MSFGAAALPGCDPSPARIPLECWEAPTKAPFSGGAVEGEELEQDMDRAERALLATEEGGNHRALKALLIIKLVKEKCLF